MTAAALGLAILALGPLQAASGQGAEEEAQRIIRQAMIEVAGPKLEEAAKKLPAAIEAARRLGWPLTVVEIPAPASRQNGALIAFPPQADAAARDPLAEEFSRRHLDDSERSWEDDPFLARLEEGLAMPAWHIDRDWEKGPFTLFPELAVLKYAAKAWGQRAVSRAKAGRRSDALHDLMLIGESAERASRERALMGWMVSQAITAMQEAAAVRLLHVWKGSRHKRQDLLAALRRSRIEPDIRLAYEGDLMTCLSAARSLEALGGIFEIGLSEGGASMAGYDAYDRPEAWPKGLIPPSVEGRAMAAIAIQTFVEHAPASAESMDLVRRSLWKRITRGEMAAWPLHTILGQPAYQEAEHRRIARTRLTDAAFSVFESVEAVGKPPARLAQRDPWSGKPLRIEVRGRKACLWSPGPDQQSSGPFFQPRTRDDADDVSIVIDLSPAG